jgi:hypothetical protein
MTVVQVRPRKELQVGVQAYISSTNRNSRQSTEAHSNKHQNNQVGTCTLPRTFPKEPLESVPEMFGSFAFLPDRILLGLLQHTLGRCSSRRPLWPQLQPSSTFLPSQSLYKSNLESKCAHQYPNPVLSSFAFGQPAHHPTGRPTRAY